MTALLRLLTFSLSFFILAPQGAAAEASEIVVLMRDRTGRDADLDARPLQREEIELLEKVARLDLEPVRVQRDGAQILAIAGPLDEASLRSVLADLRALPDVLYAEQVLPSASPRSAQGAGADETVDLLMVKPSDREQRDRADAGEPLGAPSMRHLRAVAGVALGYERPASGGVHVLRLPGRTTRGEAGEIAARLQADPSVSFAEPVGRFEAQLEPNDTFYALQWHYFEALGGVNLPPAWNVTTGSQGIVIAVLDSGVLFNHPDLTGRVLAGYDFVSSTTKSNDGGGRDGDPTDPGDWATAGFCGSGQPATASKWHGTHVTGTIAASSANGSGVAGVNWISPVLPVRVLGRCGGDWADLADAIRWAAGLTVPGAPANAYPARVINMSLGGQSSCPQAVQEAITAAVASGSVVVVAAGNESSPASQFAPGNCAGVIAVHANSRSGGYAPYSNYGAPIDVSAPGGDTSYSYSGPYGTLVYDGVLSLGDAGATSASSPGFYYKEGTSMAAPHVSGVASLVLSVNDELTPGQVETILELSAWPFPSAPGAQCNTTDCGAGIVDAANALAFTPEREGRNFYPVTPCRVVDTRIGSGGALAGGAYRSFQASGLCGVPSGAKAVAGILTAVLPTVSGHLRIWPSDRPFPGASALNFAAGAVKANNGMMRLSPSGTFSVYFGAGSGTVHVLADVTGYFL